MTARTFTAAEFKRIAESTVSILREGPAALRHAATLADELKRVRAECGVRQIQGYADGRTDRAELLQRWLDFHTAEAGMTAAIVCDRDRFDQFMTQVHSREQELIADTKAALSISKRDHT